MTNYLILVSLVAASACSQAIPVQSTTGSKLKSDVPAAILGEESDNALFGLVPQGAYVTARGLVMIVGVQNRGAEPLLLGEMVVIGEASWPDNHSLGFFAQETDPGSGDADCGGKCGTHEEISIPPGATVFTLHQFNRQQVAVDPGAEVLASVSATVGWLLSPRPQRKVKKNLLLRVEPALSKRFGEAPAAPVESPHNVGSASGTPRAPGTYVETFAALYQLPRGVVLLVGFLNRTGRTLRLLNDSIIDGLTINGQFMWVTDSPESAESFAVNCEDSETIAVESGTIYWVVVPMAGRSFPVGTTATVTMNVYLGMPFCSKALYAIQRTLVVPLVRADVLSFDRAAWPSPL